MQASHAHPVVQYLHLGDIFALLCLSLFKKFNTQLFYVAVTTGDVGLALPTWMCPCNNIYHTGTGVKPKSGHCH